MKKIVIYIMGIWMVMSACSVENDYIFDDISTTRLNQYIDECDQVLVSAEHGWKMVYYPDTTQYGGYTFLMKFSNTAGNRVEMLSDLVDTSSVCGYSYNASVGPVICFDTYGLLHLLADPDPDVFGGNAGLGYNGEYEFLISEVQQEKIILLGKETKKATELVRATAADWENLVAQRRAIADFSEFVPVQKDQPFYHYLRIGNDTAFCFYSPKLRMAYITYAEGGETVALKRPSYSTTRGIHFDTPVTFGGQTFSELAFDPLTRKMSVLDEGVGAEFFWAKSVTESCLLRLPGAVQMAKEFDAYSMVERGYNLTEGRTNLTPSGNGIKDVRWHWKLAGHPAGELYIKDEESGQVSTLGKLYNDSIAQDNIGDKIFFEAITNSKHSGNITNRLVIWFTGYTSSALNPYVAQEAGVMIIPVGGQFYMIKNDDNLSWALFTPLEENK